MSTVTGPHTSAPDAETIFGRVLAGIDGSPEALEAAELAATLLSPEGTLTLAAAWSLAPPLITPVTTASACDADETAAKRAAESALRAAKERIPRAATVMIHGPSAAALVDEAVRAESTLVAVGSHGRGRAVGILVGSTATQLIHDAPCSVLVARRLRDGAPRRIAVGVDGSSHSSAAFAVARYLAERFDGSFAVVVAEGKKSLDLAAVSQIAGDGFRVTSDEPVPVLIAASADADLLVLGTRGRHGLKALGSVAERVAHRAACSTLIVRTG